MCAWPGKAARVWFGRESWLWPLFSTSCNIPNHRTRLPRFRTIVTNINEIEIGKSRRIEVLERVCNMFSVLDRAVCTSIDTQWTRRRASAPFWAFASKYLDARAIANATVPICLHSDWQTKKRMWLRKICLQMKSSKPEVLGVGASRFDSSVNGPRIIYSSLTTLPHCSSGQLQRTLFIPTRGPRSHDNDCDFAVLTIILTATNCRPTAI